MTWLYRRKTSLEGDRGGVGGVDGLTKGVLGYGGLQFVTLLTNH